jgi:hypothetical protein
VAAPPEQDCKHPAIMGLQHFSDLSRSYNYSRTHPELLPKVKGGDNLEVRDITSLPRAAPLFLRVPQSH